MMAPPRTFRITNSVIITTITSPSPPKTFLQEHRGWRTVSSTSRDELRLLLLSTLLPWSCIGMIIVKVKMTMMMVRRVYISTSVPRDNLARKVEAIPPLQRPPPLRHFSSSVPSPLFLPHVSPAPGSPQPCLAWPMVIASSPHLNYVFSSSSISQLAFYGQQDMGLIIKFSVIPEHFMISWCFKSQIILELKIKFKIKRWQHRCQDPSPSRPPPHAL